MKQSLSEKWSVAWFKLAECIARGEKERALGVYRLLSHSFDDSAFVHQLEGDIFLVFEDHEQAIKKYYKAAELYMQHNQLYQAAAVYEHLLSLEIQVTKYLRDLVLLYTQLGIHSKAKEHIITLCNYLIHEKDYKQIGEYGQYYQKIATVLELAHFFAHIVYQAGNQGIELNDEIQEYIEYVIDLFMQEKKERNIQQFMNALQNINAEYAACANMYKESKK